MKRVFVSAAILGMMILIATPVSAERKDKGEARPNREHKMRGPGGPGEGRGPGGPGDPGRGGPHDGGSGRFLEKMLEPEVAKKLGLEAEQVKALKRGLAEVQKQEAALQTKLEAAAKEQAELLSAGGEIDEGALMKAIEKTGRIRTQMAKLRMKPILLVKKTLTEEQIKTSKKMMHERMKKNRQEWQKERGEDGDRPGKRDEEREQRRKRKNDKDGRKKKAEQADDE